MAKKKMRGVPQLGERIKRFMAASNLDASELSARTGISTSYLSRILNGEVVNPTIDFVKRIATALGVTETELVRDVNMKGLAPAGAGAFGAGDGLDAILSSSRTVQKQIETSTQQYNHNNGFLAELEQMAQETQLTTEKRMLAERLIVENARLVYQVLAKGQDQERR